MEASEQYLKGRMRTNFRVDPEFSQEDIPTLVDMLVPDNGFKLHHHTVESVNFL